MHTMKRFLIVTALLVLVACDSNSEEMPSPSLTVSPMVLTLTVGESQQLDVMVEGTATSADVMFVADVPSVARVDENGVVEAVSLGRANVIVSLPDSEVTEVVVVNVTGEIVGATCQGDFTVTSQAELATLSDCEVIDGTLTIDGIEEPVSLLTLSKLTRVTNLIIATNPALGSLRGLENLTRVTGDLEIGEFSGIANLPLVDLAPTPAMGNNSLTTLSGLNNLQSVGGDLSIANNDGLMFLKGLESLKTVSGDVLLYKNYKLTSLLGLSSLNVGGNFVIRDNASLVLLDELEEVSIGGNLGLSGNFVPTAQHCRGDFTAVNQAILDALANCTVIDGTLTINDSGFLERSSFRFDDTDDITDLRALSQLTRITNLRITNNFALTSLTGLESLITITGDLTIGDWPGIVSFPEPTPFLGNNLLTTLSGLDNLQSVGGDVSISCNDNLMSLEGLDNLETVAGNVSIFWNWGLETLKSISSVVIGGSLVISENPALEQETLTASD